MGALENPLIIGGRRSYESTAATAAFQMARTDVRGYRFGGVDLEHELSHFLPE